MTRSSRARPARAPPPARARRCPVRSRRGLFSGGAHRTAATIRAPISRWPSPAAVRLVGSAASPHRYSEANRKSPLRSPVKIRPVRLPPCAAGASPTISTRGARRLPSRAPAAPSTARSRERRAFDRRHLLAPFDQPRAGPAHRLPRRQLGQRPACAASAASARTCGGVGGTGVAGRRRVVRPAGARRYRQAATRPAVIAARPPVASDQAMPSRMSCSLTSTSAKPNRS